MSSICLVDPWEQTCFLTQWYIDNFSPIEDYNYFIIKSKQDEQYVDNLDFYECNDYYLENLLESDENNVIEPNEDYEEYTNNYESSSESEYDDYDEFN